MRFVPLLLVLVLFLPFSSASIEFASQLESEYNLGDDIGFSVKIVPDITATALVKLTLKCTGKEVPYYVAPINLKNGVEKIVEAPVIKAFSGGLCSIRVNLEPFEGGNLYGTTSKEFLISNKLELSFRVDKTDILPKEEIKIEGSASRKGKAIEEGSVIARLDDKKAQMELSGKEFSYKLKADKNIKSGKHIIVIGVNDSYGNFNEGSVEINIRAVPSVLDFYLNKKEFLPKEAMEFMVHLADQAQDPIDDAVAVKLFRKKTLFRDEIVVFDSSVRANTVYYFVFNRSTLPYEYTLESAAGELKKEETISILPYPKIEMKLEGSIVTIMNTGNVDYNNDTTIVMENEGKKYFINKKIKLDVGEETTIDLSREVGDGSYTITMPAETVVEERVIDKIVPQIVEKEAAMYGEDDADGNELQLGKTVGLNAGNVVENVEIKDNRPIYKKGFNLITGGVIAGAGILLGRPGLASFIMIAVILSLIGYFNRERIEKIIEKIKKKRERF